MRVGHRRHPAPPAPAVVEIAPHGSGNRQWVDAELARAGLRAGDVRGYVPAGEVVFDLVVPKAHLDHPRLQVILQRVRGRAFQREVEALAGYRAEEAGARISR